MLDFSEAERLNSNPPSVSGKKDNSALTVEEEIEKIKGDSDKTVVETGEGGKSERDGKDCGGEKNVNGEGSSDKGVEQGNERSNEEVGTEKQNGDNNKASSRKRPLDTAD